MKKYILYLFLFLMLLLIPISFASDNSNYNDSLMAVNDNGDMLTANYIYFDSSVANDGNGSQSSPYKYLSGDKMQDNSILYFNNGEYKLDDGVSFSNLTVIGKDSSKTIIKGNNIQFSSSGNLYFSNLTLDTLTIQNSHDLTLNNVIFQNSHGNLKSRYENIFGGAINIGSGNTLIESSTFKNNNATYGGAIYASGSSNIKVIDSNFENNFAYKYGGAIACENSVNLEIVNTNFIDCYTITNAGGAIYTKDSTLNVKKSNFTSCNSTFGGAICDLNSNLTVDSITAKDNIANYQGGAIYKMYGEMDVKSSSFTSNEALSGGAIFADNSSSVSIKSSSFTSNTAKDTGGAIYTILNTKETVSSINYKNNKASNENNYYKGKSYDLFIGNGNYIQFKGDFSFNGSLPSKYDLRDYGYVTPVKNQKSSGNCWAFTSLAALESCILKVTGKSYDLSEENMKNVIAYYSDYGWKLTTNRGGYDDMGVGYLVSWLGAVPEDFETFSDYSVLSPVLNSSIHVQNLIYLTRNSHTDNNGVKEAIIKYGAVATGIYYSGTYNKANSYYYSGDNGANHAITIVGWDDNYSKNKFKDTPQGNGAWICKNSWGESWGDKGYFYVSYYDTRCVRLGESQKSTYTFILNDTVRYDKNYQYDIIGITDYLITGKDTIWYENIYNATENELLTAFSTYFNTTTNWTAQIYVNNALKLTQSGISTTGYYTFNLNEFIPLKAGDTFKIVLKISADKFASFPICEVVRSNRMLYAAGESFFSYDGKTWTDLYNFKLNMTEYGHTYDSQVACLKAFTTTEKLTTKLSLNNIGVVGLNAPFNVTATVKDKYGNLVNYGKVKFTLNSKTYTVSVVKGKATLTAQLSPAGVYKVEAEYLNNNYYSGSSASRDINVSVKSADLTLSISDVAYGNKIVVKNTLLSGNSKVYGNVNVKINSKTYSLASNSQTTIDDILNPGKYTADGTYSNIAKASTTFNVNKIPVSLNLNIKKTDVDAANITVKLSKALNATVNVNVNSDSYSVKTKNGIGNLLLTNLGYGNYSVKASFKDKFYSDASATGAFSVLNVKTHLNADDLVMYYHNGSRFAVTLLDNKNATLSNQNVSISINGVSSVKTTNKDGTASIGINLNSGNYSVTVKYARNEKYLPSSLTKNVIVMPTIISNDLVKYFRNATQFKATILDGNGKKVTNTLVRMNINGVFYDRKTNNDGVVKLNLNLEQGNYTLTTINPITGENAANLITILPTITDNHDLVKYYKNASRYSVKVLSPTGSPLANAKVTFNINGVFYDRTTNSNGFASLAINLNPGNYVITAEYNGCRVSNNIKILSVIKTSNLSMKYRDGSRFTATILDGVGSPYPSQKISFNINGVLYDRTTNVNGTASLSIQLQAGKYIITTSYNGLNAANTITIR